MALLSGTVLNDCYYIPEFIGSGSKMMFENASAPTSWTKDTTYNNSALRVVNGTVGNGGSTAFTTILTSASVSGTVASVQSGATFNQTLSGVTIAQSASVPGTTPAALAPAPPHTHSYTSIIYSPGSGGGTTNVRYNRSTQTMGSTGGGAQHSHSFTLGAHSHTLTDVQHGHTITESDHDHPYTSTSQNFAVYYRDVILATKD
jgi:hypothetical protein